MSAFDQLTREHALSPMDEHAAGEASSSSSQAQLPRRTTRRKTALSRIRRLLVSRLSGPLLTSLILLPLVPPYQRHAIFELVPFYKSLKCLVLTSPHASKTPKHRRDVQQWLSYWTLYAFVRFLEATRCNVSTGQQRWKTLQNALDRLPRMLGERVVRLFSIGAQASSNTATAPRDMTLAAQLAGSSTRWTVIKALLLFYAMDEELHGARRIMQKIIKPIFGFFTSLDEEDDLITDEEKMYMDTHHPVRRAITSPEEKEQEHEQGRSVLKVTLEDKQEEDHDEVCM